ncbi:choice-of-anchor D domain-containing protein, partial [Amycolatopsis rhizosphaerae]
AGRAVLTVGTTLALITAAPVAEATPRAGTPETTITPRFLDFGNQTVGTRSVPRTITLTNTGTVDLVVDHVIGALKPNFLASVRCPFAPVEGLLHPGQSCVTTVIFTPASPGDHIAYLSYTTSTVSDIIVTLHGTGVTTTTSSVAVAPASAAFGQPITLTATVTCTAGYPPGTVTFTEGTTVLGSAAVSGGVASLTVNGLAAGTHSIVAHYSGGGPCPASDSAPVTVSVIGLPLSGAYPGTLVVTEPTVLAPGTWVLGPVVITGQGALDVENATITGPVTATSGTGLRMCGSTVTGPVTVSGMTGTVTVGGPGCAPNSIQGPVTVNATSGHSTIGGNTITGSLSCSGNNPPPTNAGLPNTVYGPRTGQCAVL